MLYDVISYFLVNAIALMAIIGVLIWVGMHG